MTLFLKRPNGSSWGYKFVAILLVAQIDCWQVGRAADPVATAVSATSTYDGNGNVLSRTDGNGAVTTYMHDAMKRVTAIDYPGGPSPDVSFTYDVNGNRLTMTDATGTTKYEYDIFDRLTGVSYPDGGFVDYAYDNVGNVNVIRYGNVKTAASGVGGTEIDYTFDENNRIASVKDSLANATTSYTYDNAGHPLRRTLPNGVTTDYGYDQDGRLIDVDHKKADGTRICKYSYTLNAIGNRTRVVETLPDGSTKTTVYIYDSLDRLSTVGYPDGKSVAYAYDSFGNRTRMTEATGATTKVTEYIYDGDSRLLATKVNGLVDEKFYYDNTGNLVQRARASDNQQINYTYDFESRLVRYRDGTNDVQYIYDGAGNRVAKIVNGVRGNYVNDINRECVQVVAETDAAGNSQRVYEWGNELIQQQVGSTSEYQLLDSPLGSNRFVVGNTGNILNSYDYDAFGSVVLRTENSG